MTTMAVERESTGQGRELGAQLREIRERRGLSGHELARILGWSASKVSRLESGKRGVKDIDVAVFAASCGVTGERLDHMLSLTKEPNTGYRLKPHDESLSDELRTLIFHERTAAQIHGYEPIFIPGLAQTEDYMRALFREMGNSEALTDVGTAARLGRQNLLRGPRVPDCLFLVHENALATPVGNARIMYEQMLNLIFLMSRPQFSVRVIPRSAGGRGLAHGAFQIFAYDNGGPVVFIDHETTSEFLENKSDLGRYHRTLNRLASVALDGPQSGALLATLASEYERQGDGDDGSDRPAGSALAEE